jgi:DNA-3-methyladenine glycosylase II
MVSRQLDEAALIDAVEVLTGTDQRLAEIVARFGPPPLWSRPQGFSTLARIILEQQVSLASARALFHRLEGELNGFAPESVLTAGESGLRGLGVTRQKAAYLVAAARQVASNESWFEDLALVDDAEALRQLRAIRGVGNWTASIYLLMALGRPDVWPPGDLALQKATGRLFGLTSVPTTDEAAEIATRWKPWRAVAARILWHWYLESLKGRQSSVINHQSIDR